MSTKTTITVEVENPTGDTDPVLCVRATLGDHPESMLVATKDRRLDDPETCEAVATLLRNALSLVDGRKVWSHTELRQELTAIQQMLTIADTQEKRLELSDRLIRLGRTVEPEQQGPGDMVCKAHDVAGCLKCWDPDQEEPN